MNVGNNRSLQKAKSNADDEWYTLRSEVEKGLSVFPKDTFKNKRVFCPCDGKESSFYTFFKEDFSPSFKTLSRRVEIVDI